MRSAAVRPAVGRAMQAANVVDALEDEEILRSALGKHIAIKARQSIGAGSIEQNFVSADALIQYREVAILWGRPAGAAPAHPASAGWYRWWIWRHR